MTILSDQWNHNEQFSNDLVAKSDGSIYFTDPPMDYLRLTRIQQRTNLTRVYRIKDGVTEQLYLDRQADPNGIAFSPDEKYLYVSNWDIRDIHHTKALYRV